MIMRILVTTVLLAGLAGAARSESRRFEAELANSSHRFNAGGGPIGEVPCGSASNSFAMAGMDAEGDWIEFELDLDDMFCFSDSLRADGLPGAPWRFRLLVLPAAGGDPIEDLFPEAIGHGISCPVQFEWVWTGAVHCLEAGSYRLRLIREGTGDTRVDCLDLRELPTPAFEISWSSVKALFK